MRTIHGRTRWLRVAIAAGAAILVAGLQGFITPAFAGYELPPGERITNLPHIPRSMPQKEAYEIYDPVIGRNFDLKNLWMRADLRVRPEFRNGVCFGSAAPAGGRCNSFGTFGGQGKANDFYVQQWVRLGIGYDLSPDVNFYMEIIDAANWGSNGNNFNAGNGGDPLNHSCSFNATQSGCRLGVRAAYVLIRNLAGVQGLSVKAGRQYVIFGNHSIFGHFDWANTGYSHDGIMFAYQTKAFDTYLGWFRNSEGDLAQAAPVGSLGGNVGGVAGANRPDGSGDADMFIFYNQIKTVPGFLIEPYYILYINNFHEGVNQLGGVGAIQSSGMGGAKRASQIRHHIANRIEMRKGNWDFINETAWQTGRMADGIGLDNNRQLTINAWATRNWLGYTIYENKMKPRFAVGFDYASGDGNGNCSTGTTVNAGFRCKTANTFENFFPTNHIHMGYMDIIAWKNMVMPQGNIQFRPTARDHFEIWYSHMRLASARDNWYRAAQMAYVVSQPNNTSNHIGDEIDFTWTRMFADGKVAFQATYGHMFTGSYIAKNLGTSMDQTWGFVQLWMNF